MGYSTHIFNDTPAQLSGTFVLNSTIESFVVEPKCIRVIDYPGHYNCTVKIEKYQNVDIRKLNLCRSVKYDRSVIVKQDGEFLKIVLQKYGNNLSLEEDPSIEHFLPDDEKDNLVQEQVVQNLSWMGEIPLHETYWCHIGLDVLITVFITPILNDINFHNFIAGRESIKALEFFPKIYVHLRKEFENVEYLLKLIDVRNGLPDITGISQSNGGQNFISARGTIELSRYQPQILVNPDRVRDSNQAIEALSKSLSRQNRQDIRLGFLTNWGGIISDEEHDMSYTEFIGNITILIYRAFRNAIWNRKAWEDYLPLLNQVKEMAIENANRRAMVLTVFIQTHKAWRGHHFVWALWAVISIILIWATGEDYEFYGVNEKSRVLVITRTEAKSRIYYSGKRVRIPASSLNVNPVQVIDNAYYEIFHDSF